MRKPVRMFVVATVAAWASLFGAIGHAEARRATVRVSGQAIVWKGNAQVAEAQAAAVAYRHALEEVARSLGGPKAGEDVLIDQLLYARPARFVAHSTLSDRRLRGVTL